MSRNKREFVTAHVILLLAGLVLVAVGVQLQDGSLRDCLLAIGTTLVATPIVSFLLRYFSGDPIEEVQSLLTASNELAGDAKAAGLVSIKGQRSMIPTEEFVTRASDARRRIWILTYAAEFLADNPDFLSEVHTKQVAGVDIRILVGDPSGSAILERDQEEADEGSIPSRIETTITRARKALGTEGFEMALRSFNAPLYASLYIFDDYLIACPALYAQRGSMAPALCVRESGKLFDTYVEHFDRVWQAGQVPGQ